MAGKHTLNQLYQLIASNPNLEDFLAILQILADNAADVRVQIPGTGEADSIVVRKAVHSYVKEALDAIKRIRNNKERTSPDVASDE